MKPTFKCSCGKIFPDRATIVAHEKANPGHEGAVIIKSFEDIMEAWNESSKAKTKDT